MTSPVKKAEECITDSHKITHVHAVRYLECIYPTIFSVASLRTARIFQLGIGPRPDVVLEDVRGGVLDADEVLAGLGPLGPRGEAGNRVCRRGWLTGNREITLDKTSA